MQIVFGREVATGLRENYTVLELETFDVNGDSLEAFCVIPGDKISFTEISQLTALKAMHQSLIDEYKKKNYVFVVQALDHLTGHFGGEMDSFYEVISQRIQTETTLLN